MHCGRFGCVIRLEDGRIAMLSADADGIETVRRAAGGRRRPSYPFVVVDEGRHVGVRLAGETEEERPRSLPPSGGRLSSSLEQKIIDFWRQTAEWDRSAGMEPDDEMLPRADRLLPFEMRARRQYRDQPVKRGRRPKR